MLSFRNTKNPLRQSFQYRGEMGERSGDGEWEEREKLPAFHNAVAKRPAFVNPLERELLMLSAERRDGEDGERENPCF